MLVERSRNLPPERLTAESIAAAPLRAKPFKLYDGAGLMVLVKPNGAKYWRLKYRLHGKEKSLSLGVYPDTSIEQARMHCTELRAMLAHGIDPSAARKAARETQRARGVAPPPFGLDSDGALCIRVPGARACLTPDQTAALRAFLDATRAVIASNHYVPD